MMIQRFLGSAHEPTMGWRSGCSTWVLRRLGWARTLSADSRISPFSEEFSSS